MSEEQEVKVELVDLGQGGNETLSLPELKAGTLEDCKDRIESMRELGGAGKFVCVKTREGIIKVGIALVKNRRGPSHKYLANILLTENKLSKGDFVGAGVVRLYVDERIVPNWQIEISIGYGSGSCILKTKWFSVKARKEGAFSYR